MLNCGNENERNVEEMALKDTDSKGEVKELRDEIDDRVDNMAREIDSLRKDLSESKEKLLLSLADMENLRKRFEREKEDTRKYAIASFAKELLSIVDSFERAYASSFKDMSGEKSVLLDGIKIIQKEFEKTFMAFGIKKIEALGAEFDHNFHQAVASVERSAEDRPGTVAEVLQEGYSIHDRILRPAMVKVFD
ncbi:nucleotide exchange factor GrpE [Candidatus Hydrogenosomobacter endosymbioticus]|uniref:Protein GrpE n=1 Tax=Candidatus Hydrogenosomobacter endosymbioticus TaxID=2558174 RepID=A0ABN6L386_9PROT|nr:nucleotide exchange factor GrpE [Candidatus Hydrogenosomobacter endosymbioticus]BDB96396.1 protein GrpE [Candidatus Hydrogenosomobacter endosymbioticus]